MNTGLSAIILEDEIPASNRLKRLLAEYDDEINIVAVFDSIEETAQYINEHADAPDVLFLDIHVSDGNSFELLKMIPIKMNIIFTTAYDEYAVQAFRENAIDYLMKPIKLVDLAESLDRLKQNLSKNSKGSTSVNTYKERFLFRIGSKIYSVKVEDIAYIFSEYKMSYFVTWEGRKIPSDYKLAELTDMLNPNYFFRINRQFIAHLDAIKSMKSHSKSRIKLSLNPPTDEEIIISTQRTPEFKDWMDR